MWGGARKRLGAFPVKNIEWKYYILWAYPKKMNKDIVYDSFFKPFFNFMYYLLLSPFKVEEDVNTGKYILRTNKFQKLACVATHVGTLGISFNLLLHHRVRILSDASNISRLLECIGYTSSVCAITFFTKKLWWNQMDILTFLNVARASPVSQNVVYVTSLIAHLLQLVTSYLSGTLDYAAETYVGWIIPNSVDTDSLTFKIVYHTMLGIYSLGVTLYAMGRLVTMFMAVQLKVMGEEFESFVEKQDSVRNVAEELSCLRNRVELGRKWTNEMVMFYYISVLTFLANLPEVIRIYSFGQNASGQYETVN